MGLQNKVVIVTGGARGIGKGIGMRMIEEGANVAFADLNGEEAEQTAAEAGKKGGKAIGIKVDEETRARLKAIAEAEDRSPHWLIKKALNDFLDQEELRLAERREDEARWERYVLTGEAIEHKRVRGWLEKLAKGDDAPRPR